MGLYLTTGWRFVVEISAGDSAKYRKIVEAVLLSRKFQELKADPTVRLSRYGYRSARIEKVRSQLLSSTVP